MSAEEILDADRQEWKRRALKAEAELELSRKDLARVVAEIGRHEAECGPRIDGLLFERAMASVPGIVADLKARRRGLIQIGSDGDTVEERAMVAADRVCIDQACVVCETVLFESDTMPICESCFVGIEPDDVRDESGASGRERAEEAFQERMTERLAEAARLKGKG
jgi:hypothetical protein